MYQEEDGDHGDISGELVDAQVHIELDNASDLIEEQYHQYPSQLYRIKFECEADHLEKSDV